MGFGPVFTYQHDADLEQMLQGIRDEGISVSPANEDYMFRRGRATVHGGCAARMIHLTCTHGFNPLIWNAEMGLLDDVARSFLAAGSTEASASDFLDTLESRGPDR